MDGAFYTASCPQGKLVNSVGSGDSMVAGFMAGYLDTENLKEALALGVYCGSATAFCSDLAQYEDIQRLQNESLIEIQQFTL
nr:PfkB family carbohydrate kinase [Allobaculum sp. Allo2]